MKTIEAGGNIDKGKLNIYNKNVFLQAINDIGFVNHIHLTLEYGNKRTLDQNSYLFGGVVQAINIVLRQNGYNFTDYECYKYLENRFCKTVDRNEKTGTKYHKIMPMKELSTEQFENIVMGEIRSWAEENLGIYIKMPHEYYDMDLSAYDAWKRGEITKSAAMKMTKQEN